MDKIKTKRCKYDQPELGYMQFHYDAEQRARRGEKQFRCPECDLYHWESPRSKRDFPQ